MNRRILSLLPGGLIVIGLGLRLTAINIVPAGYYYDEMDQVFTGEAVARFGTDITGNWSPFDLKPLETVNLTAELPALLQAPFQQFFGYGAQSGHLANLFFGLATAAIGMALTQSLFKNSELSCWVTGIILVNPWHVHVSRTAYEAPISMFFQFLILLGFSLLVNRKIKPGVIFILTGSFFGFFTYHGAKITIPILIMTGGIMTALREFGKKTIAALLLPGLLILCLAGYTFSLYRNSIYKSRPGELLNQDYLGQIVDSRRRLAVILPGNYLVINKATVLAEEMFKRYLFVFDVNRLFSRGTENTFQFSLFVFPYFYFSSLPLIAYGGYMAYCHYRKQFWYLTGFLVVSPAASLFTVGYQSTFRSGLTYLILLIFCGIGVYKTLIKLNVYGKVLIYGILFLETVLFAGNYFGRYPVIAADNHHFFEKLLASYIARTQTPVTVVTKNPYITARSITSYLKLMPEISESNRKIFRPANDIFELTANITVTSTCPPIITTAEHTIIMDPDSQERCVKAAENPGQRISIGSPIDSRAYYFITHDQVCKEHTTASYVHPTQLGQFEPDKLSIPEFCSVWVQKN